MFNRNIINNLNKWLHKDNRKPLILRGARQVGKTTAVELFSKSFKNYIKLDLELYKDREIFKEQYSIQELFQAILINKNVTIKPGKTLIFIDEIQNSQIAIKMLRYFYEQMKEIYVIAAGSLLEILLERQHLSFPVGRVEFLYMYPLSFEEFLAAKGEHRLLDEYNKIPLHDYAHTKLLSIFHQYTLLGGMPEIIQRYLNNENITTLSSTYESIISSYLDDSEKYASNPTMRFIIRHCIEKIPAETGNRIKFQGFGNSNYKSREVGEALRLIERAMLIYLIYPSTNIQIPIQSNLRKSPKLQFVDTGLLNYAIGLQRDYYHYSDLHSIYHGIIVEHIVRQELLAKDMHTNKKIAFWVREKKQANSEVDILYQNQSIIFPVEVKSGKTGTLRSLHQFMHYADHPYAVRLYGDKFSTHKFNLPNGKSCQLMNLPYYLAGKLELYLNALVQGEFLIRN